MSENAINIKLTVAGRTYPMTAQPEEEQGLRKAAKLINDDILHYEQEYHVNDKQDSLSLVAIQLAYKLSQTEIDEADENIEIKQKIERLLGEIDDVLELK